MVTPDAEPTPDRPVPTRIPAPDFGSVVLITDDRAWTDRMTSYLMSEGYRVLVDPTGGAAYDGRARTIDAAIIDLGANPARAIATCAAWRSRTSAPLIALVRGRDESHVLKAYAAGADHVVPLRTTSRQLLARLRSLLRRSPVRLPDAAPAGDPTNAATRPVLIDDARGVAVVNGTAVALTVHELEFLGLLLERAGRIVSRAELAARVELDPENERAIDFFVRRLREKLEKVDGQRRIIAVRGVGFRFEAGR